MFKYSFRIFKPGLFYKFTDNIKMERGQISVEYLIVVGFVIFIVLGLVGVALFYASGISDQVKLNQIESYANKIISSSESVFFAGEPSQVTITAYLPEGVQSVEVIEDPPGSGETFMLFRVSTSSGISVIAYPSDVVLMETTLSSDRGVKRILIKAEETNEVSITE